MIYTLQDLEKQIPLIFTSKFEVVNWINEKTSERLDSEKAGLFCTIKKNPRIYTMDEISTCLPPSKFVLIKKNISLDNQNN